MPIFKFSLNDLSETHNIDVYISLYVKTIYNEISMRNARPFMRDSFMIVCSIKDYKLTSDTHSQFTSKTTIMLEGQQKIKGYGRRNCYPKSALKPAQLLLLVFLDSFTLQEYVSSLQMQSQNVKEQTIFLTPASHYRIFQTLQYHSSLHTKSCKEGLLWRKTQTFHLYTHHKWHALPFSQHQILLEQEYLWSYLNLC